MNKIFVQENKKYIIIGSALIGFLVVILTMITAYYMYFLNTPVDKNASTTTFVVAKGDGVTQMSANLEEKGIIRTNFTFLVYLKLSGLSSSIQAGDYNLSGAMSPRTVADILTSGKVTSEKITIPEGWTNDDIGNYLEKEGIVSKASFELATKKSYDYEFLVDKPAGSDLEGYLFPDTYQISATADADAIVNIMLENLDQKLTPSLRAAIKGSGMSTFEVVTLASVVEREVSKPEDRKVVAGIFENRLDIGMALQSDATVQYILNSDKKRFSYDESRVESPYNTYLYPGLPIGPIGNPGIDSIQAVLYPDKSSFFYFLSADGITYYSKTLEEHEEKIARYLD